MSTLLKFAAKELGLSKGKIKDMIRDKKIEAELVEQETVEVDFNAI